MFFYLGNICDLYYDKYLSEVKLFYIFIEIELNYLQNTKPEILGNMSHYWWLRFFDEKLFLKKIEFFFLNDLDLGFHWVEEHQQFQFLWDQTLHMEGKLHFIHYFREECISILIEFTKIFGFFLQSLLSHSTLNMKQ